MGMNKTIIFFTIVFLFLLREASPVFAQVKIGVLLPLMKNSPDAESKKVGEIMLKGIRDALEDYQKSGKAVEKVALVIEDTKRESGVTLDQINKLAADKDLIAIFGPVYSSELSVNAGSAEFHKLPIVTPTATSNDLAKKNPYVFQLNPVYDTRGRLMSKYAMDELGMCSFLVLSEDTYGKLYSEGFMDEVADKNCIIKGKEFYSKDDTDFTNEIENLKAAITKEDWFIDFGSMERADIDKLKIIIKTGYNIDSLAENKISLSVYRIFGKEGKAVADSLKISTVKINETGKKFITGLADAIYIPVSGYNQIPDILTAMHSAGMILPILGTSDWNNETALLEAGGKFDLLYIESDFYLSDLSSEYLNEVKGEEYKNYYFGYDGMKLLLDEISEGNRTRESLNESLGKINNYKTNHINITMKERSNVSLSILKYDKGKLKKITDYVY